MSDGNEESRKAVGPSSRKKNTRKNDEFAQSVARLACAQVFESVGFNGFQQSALNTLGDVVCRYIHEIGRNANSCANLAGRMESNVFDIVQGLEEMEWSQGFLGASENDDCHANSGVVREITRYVSEAEEVAFAYSVPNFPVVKERERVQSFDQAGEEPPFEHIPPWLPRFPDTETSGKMASTSMVMAEMRPGVVEKGLTLAEPSALELKQHISCNGSELLMDVDQADTAINPFLAAPLQFGEKEASSIVPPAKFFESGANIVSCPDSSDKEKTGEIFGSSVIVNAKYPEEGTLQNHAFQTNHVSVSETFASAIEAMKEKGGAFEEGSKSALLNSRPKVKLTLGRGMKLVNTAATSWFAGDDVSDNKKRRVEQILKESMETTESHEV